MKFFSNSTANTFTRSAAVNVLPDAMLAFGTGKPWIGAQKIFFSPTTVILWRKVELRSQTSHKHDGYSQNKAEDG